MVGGDAGFSWRAMASTIAVSSGSIDHAALSRVTASSDLPKSLSAICAARSSASHRPAGFAMRDASPVHSAMRR